MKSGQPVSRDELRRWARQVHDRLCRLEQGPAGEAIARANYRKSRIEAEIERKHRLKLALLDKKPEDFSHSDRICTCGRVRAHYQVQIAHQGKHYLICPYLLVLRLQRLRLNGYEPLIDLEFLVNLRKEQQK